MLINSRGRVEHQANCVFLWAFDPCEFYVGRLLCVPSSTPVIYARQSAKRMDTKLCLLALLLFVVAYVLLCLIHSVSHSFRSTFAFTFARIPLSTYAVIAFDQLSTCRPTRDMLTLISSATNMRCTVIPLITSCHTQCGFDQCDACAPRLTEICAHSPHATF